MNYIEKLENNKLFVLCKSTIEDCEGIYCLRGKEYKVVDIGENENFKEHFIIETEWEDEMQINMDDLDFEVIVK